ncbi:MAG: IS200/IS605 family transposase [Phycisphaerales bacterium]
MPSSYTQSYFHLVFGTHQRQPWIDERLHDRLYAFIGGIARDLGKGQSGQLVAGNGARDHVHLLVRCPPDVSLAELAREVEARSSKWIHETFPDLRRFAWQRGYGGFTVSRSQIEDVEKYIRTQDEHHKVMTFQDEFRAMLEKHGVAFDPRYLE